MMKRIALIGYMGSGKSHWANILAAHYNLPAIDMDEQLETHDLGMSIAAFVSRFGELAFRKKEHSRLHQLADQQTRFILATGGGTPCYFTNMEVLNRSFTTVYLKSTIAELYERIKDEKAKRPLISHVPDDALKEFIAKHLFERNVFYSQAHLHLETAGLTKEHLIKQIDAYTHEHLS
jgi:shikimate kinase